MRILFVAPYVPSLIRVRPYHFIRRLSELGHEITLVALGADGAVADGVARAALLPYCRAVHVIPLSKRESAFHCLGSLATGTPLWAAYCFSRRMDQTLRQILADEKFDIAHIEHLRAAHFATILKDHLPLVFDSVDCITDLQRQMMRAPGRNALARAVSWEEQVKLRRYEPRIAAVFSRVLITSTPDADGLQRLAGAQGLTLPMDVIPNGVDLDYFSPQPDVRPVPGSMVLTGKMSYAANEDAALYFCRDIFPLIRRECPNATVTIAGSGPGASLLALAKTDDAITVTGRVDDLRPYIARAAVAVCPLRIGVGIQNKALEAMAMGKAVVTTPLAARVLGTGVVSVAEDAPRFAAQVVVLLSDPDAVLRLGRAARAYVEAHHDWRRAARRLGEIYRDVAGVA